MKALDLLGPSAASDVAAESAAAQVADSPVGHQQCRSLAESAQWVEP